MLSHICTCRANRSQDAKPKESEANSCLIGKSFQRSARFSKPHNPPRLLSVQILTAVPKSCHGPPVTVRYAVCEFSHQSSMGPRALAAHCSAARQRTTGVRHSEPQAFNGHASIDALCCSRLIAGYASRKNPSVKHIPPVRGTAVSVPAFELSRFQMRRKVTSTTKPTRPGARQNSANPRKALSACRSLRAVRHEIKLDD